MSCYRVAQATRGFQRQLRRHHHRSPGPPRRPAPALHRPAPHPPSSQPDTLSLDIVRPKTSKPVPVIMEESPYYDGSGRGMLDQKKVRDRSGVVAGAAATAALDSFAVKRTATTDAGTQVSAGSTGKVGMIGKSADGGNALDAASTGNPALVTAVSIEGPANLFAVSAPGGIFDSWFRPVRAPRCGLPSARPGCRASYG
ncbi:MAG: CocE/NonD family hydrolase [Nakamurella sp.]